jgi:hypothetical protein
LYPQAQHQLYGVLLSGTGQIWFKEVNFETDDSVPETGPNKGRDQSDFIREKIKAIANEIKKITEEEKNALKAEIEIIDKELASEVITKKRMNLNSQGSSSY